MSYPNKPAPAADSIQAPSSSHALVVDGACFTKAAQVAVVLDDSVQTVTTGTAVETCAAPAYGPVGTYCYVAKVSPFTHLAALQPLHAPAATVAPLTNLTRCFWQPELLTSGTIALSSVTPVSLCGTAFRYTGCTANTTLIVVYASGTAHQGVQYQGQCYAYGTEIAALTSANTGTAAVVSSTVIVATSGSTDVLCTGSSPTGASVPYVDSMTGRRVFVQFDDVASGIPVFGVAPVKSEPDFLMAGFANVHFLAEPVASLFTATGSGRLSLTFTGRLAALGKRVLRTRGGTTATTAVRAGVGAATLDVVTGDVVELAIGREGSKLGKTHRGTSGQVHWAPELPVLRLYDTGTLNASGTVLALSFCGLSARSRHSLHTELPVVIATASPTVQGVVTVVSSGTEYGLLRSRAIGQALPEFPTGSFAYSGTSLASPLLFQFYGAGETQGAHGEMDVRLSSDGTFPGAFRAGLYRELVRSGTWYRRTGQTDDVHRSSLAVASGPSGKVLNTYRSSTGRHFQAYSTAEHIALDGEVYALSSQDYGVSCCVEERGVTVDIDPPDLVVDPPPDPPDPPDNLDSGAGTPPDVGDCSGEVTFACSVASLIKPQLVLWRFSGQVEIRGGMDVQERAEYVPTAEFPKMYESVGEVSETTEVITVKFLTAYHQLGNSGFRSVDVLVDILDEDGTWYSMRGGDMVEFYAADYDYPIFNTNVGVVDGHIIRASAAADYGLEKTIRRASERVQAAYEMRGAGAAAINVARYQDALTSGPYPPNSFFEEARWELAKSYPCGYYRFEPLLSAAATLNEIKSAYLRTDVATDVADISTLNFTDVTLPPIDTVALANPSLTGAGFTTYANAPSAEFITISAGGAVAQAINGRGMLTTVAFTVHVDFAGTADSIAADSTRLKDSVEIWDDVGGVPGILRATFTVRPGDPDPLVCLARCSNEFYLTPTIKQWLVWRAAADADWKVAVGGVPDPDDEDLVRETALAYDDAVVRWTGGSWTPLDSETIPSVAFSLGTHPWQILHKECRRLACALRYLHYEHEIPNYVPRFDPWWAENMASTYGVGWFTEQFHPRTSQYGDSLQYFDLTCAASQARTMVRTDIYPLVPPQPQLFPHLSEDQWPVVPMLGTFEGNSAWYMPVTDPGADPDMETNYFSSAACGMASFNVGEVKNYRVVGKKAILVPRIGVVSAVVLTAGLGHVAGETVQVSNATADTPAVIRVNTVGLDGEITSVTVQLAGRFVSAVGNVVLGDATINLDFGVMDVTVADGGEGFESSALVVLDTSVSDPATYQVFAVPCVEGGFTVQTVSVLTRGSGYGGVPDLPVTGAGGMDASCLFVHGCLYDGGGYLSTVVGPRVGLPAKAFIKIAANVYTSTSNAPYSDYTTIPLATGDPRMKTPVPPVRVTTTPSYQSFGNYTTTNRYVNTVGVSLPNWELPCPPPDMGLYSSDWKVKSLAIVVNRAGNWRY